MNIQITIDDKDINNSDLVNRIKECISNELNSSKKPSITEEEFINYINKGILTLDICKEWVEGGGDVNIQNKWGDTALYWASWKGFLDIVQYLVENGAKIDLQDKNGDTILIWASYLDHLDIVKVLVENGANIYLKNKWGCTALDLAKTQDIKNYLKIINKIIQTHKN